MINNKVKTVFKGLIQIEVCSLDNYNYDYHGTYSDTKSPKIWKREKIINYKTFYEKEETLPIYNINDKVYIDDLDLTIVITDKIMSINGDITYITDHVVEVIENEESINSKTIAENKLEEEMLKYNKWLKDKKEAKDLKESEPIKQEKVWFDFFKRRK